MKMEFLVRVIGANGTSESVLRALQEAVTALIETVDAAQVSVEFTSEKEKSNGD